MAIDLENLNIDKLIVHHIYKRDTDKQPVEPTYGTSLLTPPPAALTAFQLRVTESLGHKSRGMEMDINDDSPESFFQKAAGIFQCPDSEYIEETQKLAYRFARIQANRDLKACKLLFISGRAGSGSKPFLTVIKAELQDGFSESGNTLEYFQDLFLTPSQRFYKIGFLHNLVTAAPDSGSMYNPAHYESYLFDHLLTTNESRSAAHYFYADFLGMEIRSSDKRLTKEFFEHTKTYINTMNVDQDKKVELLEALRTELRSNQATLQTSDFATKYLEENIRSSYTGHMNDKGVPETAFSKNLEYINTRLRKKQSITFRGGVQLTTPADQLHQLVKITEQTAEHTIVKINAPIESQE